MTSIILQNLYDVQSKIQHAERCYGRVVGSVKLLAVSKGQTVEKIKILYEAGQRLFGENYLQEALLKQQQLADLPIEWHFIGRIQSNKIKLIAEQFAWIHTVSRIETAMKLNHYRPSHLPPLNVCIQVNVSDEESKAGILPDQLDKLASQIIMLPHLRWRGLMILPPPASDRGTQRRQFAELRLLFESLTIRYSTLDTLSMGMSADMEAAIAEGATIVRVGTAIFGKRA